MMANLPLGRKTVWEPWQLEEVATTGVLQLFPWSSLKVLMIGFAEDPKRVHVATMRPAVGVEAKVFMAIQFLSRNTLESGERAISTGGSKVAPPLVDRLSNTELMVVAGSMVAIVLR